LDLLLFVAFGKNKGCESSLT